MGGLGCVVNHFILSVITFQVAQCLFSFYPQAGEPQAVNCLGLPPSLCQSSLIRRGNFCIEMQRNPLQPWFRTALLLWAAGKGLREWRHSEYHPACPYINTEVPLVILCVSVVGELVSRIRGWTLETLSLLVWLHALDLLWAPQSGQFHRLTSFPSGSETTIIHVSFSWHLKQRVDSLPAES